MRFGKIDLKEINWERIEEATRKIEEEKGIKSVNPEKEHTYWYERTNFPDNGNYISKIQGLSFVSRKKEQGIDRLTSKIYNYFQYDDHEIIFVKLSNKYGSDDTSILVQQGTSFAISQLSSKLGIATTMRKKITFSEEFIEFLNTADKNHSGYSLVFEKDMLSTGRKSKRPGHSMKESYESMDRDIIKRSDRSDEDFREAAILKITPDANLVSSIPTTDLALYRDWIDIINPKRSDQGILYYEATLHAYNRVEKAFNNFKSL
ncbi:MAG: hypothetical protein ACYCSO_00860 [Cuniculiplasma sp.]